jgi:hypothetical protein
MITYIVTPIVDKEKLLEDFLLENGIPFVKENDTLPSHVLESIEKSRADFEAGRFITHEEFKNRIGKRK